MRWDTGFSNNAQCMPRVEISRTKTRIGLRPVGLKIKSTGPTWVGLVFLAQTS